MFTRPTCWSAVAVAVSTAPVEPPRLSLEEPGPYGHEPYPRPSVTVGAGEALPATVVADDVPTPIRTPPATPAAVRVAAIATRVRRADAQGCCGAFSFSVTRTVHRCRPRPGCGSAPGLL